MSFGPFPDVAQTTRMEGKEKHFKKLLAAWLCDSENLFR